MKILILLALVTALSGCFYPYHDGDHSHGGYHHDDHQHDDHQHDDHHDGHH